MERKKIREIRNIATSGNSCCIIIPRVWMKANGLEKGNKIVMLYDFDSILITTLKDDN